MWLFIGGDYTGTSKITYESRVEKAIEKVQAKPWKALNIIGAFLVKQIKLVTAKAKEPITIIKKDGSKEQIPPGRLVKGNKYKVIKKENKLILGNKEFWSMFIEFGTSRQPKRPFFANTVQSNMDTIKKLLEATYKELNDENVDTINDFQADSGEDNLGGS